MSEEHLSQAAGQRDLVPVEQEAEEHPGDDGAHCEDVNNAGELVHGAAQELHAVDHVHQQSVSQQHRQVGGREQQRQQPAVPLLLRERSEHEGAVEDVVASNMSLPLSLLAPCPLSPLPAPVSCPCPCLCLEVLLRSETFLTDSQRCGETKSKS